MKATNLYKLKELGYQVPDFLVFDNVDNIQIDTLSGNLFAVRSSYSKEDTKQHSYAGQFETILNVSKEDIITACHKVFSATSRSKHYQSIQNLQDDGKMRVIVQEMINSEVAGVLFSANPQGILNEMVFVVGRGLGDGVVDGTKLVNTYYYNKDMDSFYNEIQDESICLSIDIVNELCMLASKIQNDFETYVDIEFAIKDGIIWILQVRPITTLPKQNKIILDNSNIVESYPGISYPLTQDFASVVYTQVFTSVVTLLSSQSKANDVQGIVENMVQPCNGRMYYSINQWYTLLHCLPFKKKIIPIWQEMLGVESNEIVLEKNIPFSIFDKMIMFIKFPWLLYRTPKKMKQLDDYFVIQIEHYKNQVKKCKTSEEYLSLYKEMEIELGKKWGITLLNDLYAFIFTALAKKKHQNELQNIAQLESIKPVYALQQIVAVAKTQGMNSSKYHQMVGKYIENYGDRCLEELKLETKTFRTNPELLDAYITSMLECKVSLETSHEPAKKTSFSLRHAKLGILNRESSRLNRCRIFGVCRSILLEIGKIMHENKHLENHDDIFWLHIHEIEQYSITPKSYNEVISKRKKEYEQYEHIPAYNRLVFNGTVFNKTMVANTSQMIDDNKALHGTPCSPGKVKAQVLVLDKPSLDIDTSGKIIVTTTTDPGWVFLLQHASGIIAEKGSLLSHTAIITRELQIPSIVGVKDATKRLTSGQVIELDGSSGRITLIEED